jgi:ElaB/YqjD/DUF883 family membrane-anchored ribosome-binding protein
MFSAATKTAADLTEKSAEHDAKSAFNDAKSAINDAKSNVNAATATAQKLFKDVTDDAADYAEDAQARVRHFTDRAVDQARTATERAKDQISGNPGAAAAILVGVGVLVGMFLAGSSRRTYR